jgi:alpha-tubulin suppressor-like RCC1 family protein
MKISFRKIYLISAFLYLLFFCRNLNAQIDVQMSQNVFLYLKHGKLYIWGNNEKGIFKEWGDYGKISPKIASNDTTWTSIDGSSLGFVGLKKDGSIWGIGLNTFGQFGGSEKDTIKYWKNLSSSNDWLSIGITEKAIYALNIKGEIWSMGQEIGDGTVQMRNSWQQIKSYIKWKKIFVDEGTSFFITDYNALYGYGRYRGNERSSLSLNFDSVKIGAIANEILDIRSSESNTVVLWDNNKVTVLGSNIYGQFNVGVFSKSSDPERDILHSYDKSFNWNDSGYLSISVANGLWAGVKRNREIYGCGLNICGNLGDGTDSNRNKVIKSTVFQEIDKVFLFSTKWNKFGHGSTISSSTTFALDKYLNLFSLGHNSMNECGEGSVFFEENFKNLSLNKIKKIKSYNGSSFALDDNNQLWFTGENSNNQIGKSGGFIVAKFPYTTNTWSKCIEGDSVVDFDLTTQGIIVLKSDGWLWSWGNAIYGDRLINTTWSNPTKVTQYNNWKQIKTNAQQQFNFTAVLNIDGFIKVLGNNPLLPEPKSFLSENKFESFAVGHNSIYAIRNDSVWVWGNSLSNLGVGNYGNPLNPKVLAGKWKMIFANKISGFNQTFGIDVKGHLYGWGISTFGNLGTIDSINDTIFKPMLIDSSRKWTQIISELNTCFGLTSEGEIYYWGQNRFNKTSTKASVNEIISKPNLFNNSRKWKFINFTTGRYDYQGYYTKPLIGTLFAIDSSGILFGIGSSRFGVMGNNSHEHIVNPILLVKGSNNAQLDVPKLKEEIKKNEIKITRISENSYRIETKDIFKWDKVQLFEIDNKLITEESMRENNKVFVDIKNIEQGIYILCFSNQSMRLCKKVIFD